MTNVDLLVFGPHPDDIEIGFGGAVALHVAQGFRVGLCDLTRGELGSNGTVDDRLAEAEAARAVLGADWRVNFAWPDGGPFDTPAHADDVVGLVRACRPEVVALPVLERPPSRPPGCQRGTESCGLQGGPAALPAGSLGACLVRE